MAAQNRSHGFHVVSGRSMLPDGGYTVMLYLTDMLRRRVGRPKYCASD